MAFMGEGTDKKTGDKFQLYLGMNYAVPVNSFLMDGQSLPDSFSVRNIPTLVLPKYAPGRKFIAGTWLFSDLYMTKIQNLSMGDFAHNQIRASNSAVDLVEARIDPSLEYDVLGYLEDGSPKLGLKRVEDKTWQHSYGTRTITVPIQIYQLAPIQPGMFPPVMKAYYPYARDIASIKSYQETEISPREIAPRHSAVMEMLIDRYRKKPYVHGGPVTDDVYRGPIRKLDMDVESYNSRPVFPVNPARYQVTFPNKKAPVATATSATSAQNVFVRGAGPSTEKCIRPSVRRAERAAAAARDNQEVDGGRNNAPSPITFTNGPRFNTKPKYFPPRGSRGSPKKTPTKKTPTKRGGSVNKEAEAASKYFKKMDDYYSRVDNFHSFGALDTTEDTDAEMS